MKERSYFFEPWVGERYREGFKGVRTLVAGVCHICSAECRFHRECASSAGVRERDCRCPDYSAREDQEYYRLSNSNNIEITSFIDGDTSYPAYKLFTYYMLKCAENLPPEKKLELWDHLAFTNFLQFMHDDTEMLPEDQAVYENDYPAFRELVERLEPEVVIVWNDRVKECVKSHPEDFKYLGKANLPFGIFLYVFKPKDSPLAGDRLSRLRYRLGIKSEPRSLKWYKDLLRKHIGKCFSESGEGKEKSISRFANILMDLVGDGYLGATEENLYFLDSDDHEWTSRLKGYFLSKIKYSFPDLGRGLNPGIEGIFKERLATNKKQVDNPKPGEERILKALDNAFKAPKQKKTF